LNTYERVKALSDQYDSNLKEKTSKRVSEMKEDNLDHYLIYEVLGVSFEEGELIDVYQNKGRFLYKNAGAFVEEAVLICFQEKFGDKAQAAKIPNTESNSPKKFEIDCLVNEEIAHEIKWRDATTDGDHIRKEKNRIIATEKAGYTPVRLMFFKPNRKQAQKIQKSIEQLYKENRGNYYSGKDAWDYVFEKTGVDLKAILIQISQDKDKVDKDKEIAVEKILEKDE